MLSTLRHSRLFSNSAIYLLSNIARAAVPFALLPILTRYLTPAEYGTVAMFQILVAALAAVIGVSVHGAANRKFFDPDVSQHELAQYIGSCMQILVVTTLLGLAVAIAFQQPLSIWLGLEPTWIAWAVLVAAASFLINLRLGQWQVRGAATRYGAMQILSSLSNMLIAVLLVTVLLRGAAGSIEAQTWTLSVFAVLAIYLLAKDKLLAFSWRPDYLREALNFGLPLVPHIVGLFLLNAADRLVIKTQLGLTEAGIYMVALQITMAMSIVFDAINKAYVPWLYERLARNNEEEKKQIVRWTYAFFGATLAIAAFAFWAGPYAIRLLTGHEYHEAGQLIGWLAIGQAFAGMYLAVTNYIFYSKKTGLLALTSISSSLINLALLVVLVKFYGLIGAAWAFAIAMGFRFVLTWLVAQKRHPMPWLK